MQQQQNKKNSTEQAGDTADNSVKTPTAQPKRAEAALPPRRPDGLPRLNQGKAPPALESAAAASPGAAGRKAGEKRRFHRGVVVCCLLSAGFLLGALLVALAGGLWPGASGPDGLANNQLVLQPPPQESGLSTAAIVQQLSPSVVSIDTYEENALTASGSGSGVVLTEDGFILTCAHVVHTAPIVRVVLASGSGYVAVLVGIDPKTDLAVLKIEATGLEPANFGDSSAVAVGERVVAVGNTAGILPGSTSQGIISGLGRQVSLETIDGATVHLDLLQTDAAINPGNSGGALANAHGQVVGITVAKLDDSSVENVGFAIPSAQAVPIARQLMEGVQYGALPKLGVAVVALNETTGPPQGLPSTGLYVVQVTPESHLAQQDVKPGDVLLSAQGEELTSTGQLLGILARFAPGDEIELEVWTQEGQAPKKVTATLYAGES